MGMGHAEHASTRLHNRSNIPIAVMCSALSPESSKDMPSGNTNPPPTHQGGGRSDDCLGGKQKRRLPKRMKSAARTSLPSGGGALAAVGARVGRYAKAMCGQGGPV